jgi:prolyl 4-hydroxylase
MFNLMTPSFPKATMEAVGHGLPDTLGRADAARLIGQRIAAFPGAMRMPARDLELYMIRDFITPDTCADLIAIIDASCAPSPVIADDPIPDYRTSETSYLAADDPAARSVEARLDALTGIDPVHGELLQGQRYAVGQEFKAHHDFFDTDQLYWRDQVAIGGQRTWTAMAFLNEPEAGGRTNFPTAGMTVSPRAGNLLVWNNIDEFGVPNQASLHQGMPVESGVKYVLTKWYRERPWGHQK